VFKEARRRVTKNVSRKGGLRESGSSPSCKPSLAPGFSPVVAATMDSSRFNGLNLAVGKKNGLNSFCSPTNWTLKPGAN
jgi:hypothetical protein